MPIFFSIENFATIWRHSRCRWRFYVRRYVHPVRILEVAHYLWQGTSVFMVISEDSWYFYLLLSVWQWNGHYLFNDLRDRHLNTWPSACETKGLTHCFTAAMFMVHHILSKKYNKREKSIKHISLTSLTIIHCRWKAANFRFEASVQAGIPDYIWGFGLHCPRDRPA